MTRTSSKCPYIPLQIKAQAADKESRIKGTILWQIGTMITNDTPIGRRRVLPQKEIYHQALFPAAEKRNNSQGA